MGEVYRAHDSRLGRDVALKILPEHFTADPDRLARFEREARMLASLNHPNIAAIYGVEDTDGVRALVLELVEGETLAERIARGPVPVKEALAIARQIVDALDAAHEKGIIHRDLKPANVKITPAGTVKVLDFGLAKAAEPADVGIGASAATVRLSGSHAGMVIGTAAYMSPEQARGQALDKRTDIWAFGCVLFELLTGRSTFGKSTVTDTLAAVIEREPDWTALPAATPAATRRLLERCLEKDPRRRLRDVGDVSFELVPTISGQASPRPRRMAAWLAMSTAAALLLAFGSWQWWGREASNAAIGGYTSERLTYDSGLTTAPALSRDGRLLAYASDRSGRGLDIWVQQVSGGVPLRITDDPAEDMSPDFSPDGTQIVFRSERDGGGIYAAPALGGPARLILRDGRDPRFSPDGTRLAYWAGQWRGDASLLESAVFVASLDGGAPHRLLPEFVMARSPVWAPDGRSLLVLGRRDTTSPVAESFDWWWVPLGGGAPFNTGVVARTGDLNMEPGAWTDSGVLFSLRNDLWRVQISPADGSAGDPERLTAGTSQATRPASGLDGTVVFASHEARDLVDRQHPHAVPHGNRPRHAEQVVKFQLRPDPLSK